MVVDGSLGVHDVPLEGVLRVLGSQGIEGVDIAMANGTRGEDIRLVVAVVVALHGLGGEERAHSGGGKGEGRQLINGAILEGANEGSGETREFGGGKHGWMSFRGSGSVK